MLSRPVNSAAASPPTSLIAEGTSSAIVARNSRLACRRALTRLYSCTRYVNPPRRNDAPSMKSVLVTIAPAIDAFTSVYWPARSAARAITSSVRLPSVALSSPPTVSPVFAATDSVAWLSSAASGTIASTDRTNSSVGDSMAGRFSRRRAPGTNTNSHKIRLCRISSNTAFTGCVLLVGVEGTSG